MSKNWKRGLALLMAAMMLAPSSNLTAWQTALGSAMIAEAAVGATHVINYIEIDATGAPSTYVAGSPLSATEVENATTTFIEGSQPTITFPTRDGYSAKLYTDYDITSTKLSNGDVKEITADGTNFPKDTQTEVDVYVLFEENEYTIEYELNGGTGTDAGNKKYKIGTQYNLLVPTRKNFSFGGWYTDPEFDSETKITTFDSNDAETDPILAAGAYYGGNLKLYAKWIEGNYTVSYKYFDADNGASEGDALPNTALPDDAIKSFDGAENNVALPLPTSVKIPGYKFEGWYNNSKSNSNSQITQIPANADANFDAYAKLSAGTDVTFEYNKEKDGTTDLKVDANSSDIHKSTRATTSAADEVVTIPADPVFTNADYKFYQWNTKADGTGAEVTEETKLSSLVTTNKVFAISKKMPIPTFKLVDGTTAGCDPTHTPGSVAFAGSNEFSNYELVDSKPTGNYVINYLPVPASVPSGKTFIGWYSSARCEDQYKVELGDVVESDSPTYYAKIVDEKLRETSTFTINPAEGTNPKDYSIKVTYVNDTIGAATGSKCNSAGQTVEEWIAANPATNDASNFTASVTPGAMWTPDRSDDGSFIVAKDAEIEVTITSLNPNDTETIVDKVTGVSTVSSTATAGVWQKKFTVSGSKNASLTVATKKNLQSTVVATANANVDVTYAEAVDQEGVALDDKTLGTTAYFSKKLDKTISFKVAPKRGFYVSNVKATLDYYTGTTNDTTVYAKYDAATDLYSFEVPEIDDADPDAPTYDACNATITIVTQSDATTEFKLAASDDVDYQVVELFNTQDDLTTDLDKKNNYERVITPKGDKYQLHTAALSTGLDGNVVKVVATSKTTGKTVKIEKADTKANYEKDPKVNTVDVAVSYETATGNFDSTKPYVVLSTVKTTYQVSAKDFDNANNNYVNTVALNTNGFADKGIAITSDPIVGYNPFTSFNLEDAEYGKDYVFYAYPVVENTTDTNVKKEANATDTLSIKAYVKDALGNDVYVPVTKLADDKYMISGSSILGAGQDDTVLPHVDLTITAKRVDPTSSSSFATVKFYQDEYNVKDDKHEDVEQNSVHLVSNQTKQYDIFFIPDTATKEIESDKVTCKVVVDNLVKADVTAPANITATCTNTNMDAAGAAHETLTVKSTNVKSGSATINIYYDNELVKTIPVDVVSGIGNAISAKVVNVSDVKATVEITANADASFEDIINKRSAVEVAGIIKNASGTDERLYYVVTSTTKNIFETEKPYYNEITKIVPFSNNKQVIDIDLQTLGIKEGEGVSNDFSLSVALVRDTVVNAGQTYAAAGATSNAGKPIRPTLYTEALREAGTPVSLLKTTVQLEKDAAEGKLLETSVDYKTTGSIYETDLTFSLGSTRLATDVIYDNLLVRDSKPVILTANYTNKTSYKKIYIKDVVAKKLNKKVAYRNYTNLENLDLDPFNYDAGVDIDDYLSVDPDGTKLYAKNLRHVVPGTYEITVEAYAPKDYQVANPSTIKFNLEVIENDEAVTKYGSIVRPDNTKKNMNVQPLTISGRNTVASTKYSFDKGLIYSVFEDSAGNQLLPSEIVAVDPSTLGISITDRGVVSISKEQVSLNGVALPINCEVVYKDGTTHTEKFTTVIRSESSPKLTNIVLVKSADVGPGLTVDKFLDPEIEIDELNKGTYSLIAVEVDDQNEVKIIDSDVLLTVSGSIAFDSDGVIDDEVVPGALNVGTIKVTARRMDFSKKSISTRIKVTKSKNKVALKITDANAQDNDSALNGPYDSVFTNTAEMSQPIDVRVLPVKANGTSYTDAYNHYVLANISVSGGKIVNRYATAFSASYKILPTAEKTTIKVVNSNDKTDVKTYTITNSKYINLKSLAFKTSQKVNGSADKTVSQVIKYTITGPASQLAEADYVNLSANSLKLEYEKAQFNYFINPSAQNKARMDAAEFKYDTACDIIALATANNGSPNFLVETPVVNGRLSYIVELDLTDDPAVVTNYEGIAAGNYVLDVRTYGTVTGVGTIETSKESKLSVAVTNVKKASATPNPVLTLTDVKGESAKIEYTSKNGGKIQVEKVLFFKDTITGKRNYFDNYFTVDCSVTPANGLVTVAKAGAIGNDLKAVIEYYETDANGRILGDRNKPKQFTISVSTATPQKHVEDYAAAGVKRAVGKDAIETYYDFNGTKVDDAVLTGMIKDELRARGYVFTGDTIPTGTATAVNESATVNVTSTPTCYEAPDHSHAGIIKNARVQVVVSTKFYSAEEAKAYNKANNYLVGNSNYVVAGDPVAGYTKTLVDFVINETYSKKLENKLLVDAVDAVKTLNGITTGIFTGVETKDKATLLAMASELAGEGWKVEMVNKLTDHFTYSAPDAGNTGSMAVNFKVTKLSDKRITNETGTVTITLNQLITLADAKAKIDAMVKASTSYNYDVTVNDIVLQAQTILNNENAYAFKVSGSNLVVTPATSSKAGSVTGYLTINRIDNMEDATNIAVNQKSGNFNAKIVKTLSSPSDALAVAIAAVESDECKLLTTDTNADMKDKVAKAAQKAVNERVSGAYKATVTNFVVTKTADGLVASCTITVSDVSVSSRKASGNSTKAIVEK